MRLGLQEYAFNWWKVLICWFRKGMNHHSIFTLGPSPDETKLRNLLPVWLSLTYITKFNIYWWYLCLLSYWSNKISFIIINIIIWRCKSIIWDKNSPSNDLLNFFQLLLCGLPDSTFWIITICYVTRLYFGPQYC